MSVMVGAGDTMWEHTLAMALWSVQSSGEIFHKHAHSVSTVVMASAAEEYSLCVKLFNSVLKGDWRLKIASLRKMSLTSRFEICPKIALLFWLQLSLGLMLCYIFYLFHLSFTLWSPTGLPYVDTIPVPTLVKAVLKSVRQPQNFIERTELCFYNIK